MKKTISRKISSGTVHTVSLDIKHMLISSPRALTTWESITPLARNEWICWMESGKKEETRVKRIKVGKSKLESGDRRPCCWSGCVHR